MCVIALYNLSLMIGLLCVALSIPDNQAIQDKFDLSCGVLGE